MITEENVLKSIVDCRRPNGRTMYTDIEKDLSLDSSSLVPFLRNLESKNYIETTMEDITITQLGLLAYNDIMPVKTVKKSIHNFSKLVFQRIIEIIVGIIVGIAIAYITYHFGWQQS